MLKKGIWIVLGISLIAGIGMGVYLGFEAFKERKKIEQLMAFYSEAETLLAADEAREALALLNQHYTPQMAQDVLRQWSRLMVKAALRSKRYDQLEKLLQQSPGLLLEDEIAALWWSRVQMHRRLWSNVIPLIGVWAPKWKYPERWKLLEADHLLLEGKREEARFSLESWSGTGGEEVNRQLRLALSSGNNFAQINEYLSNAYRLMPESTDTRSFAAMYLELQGNLVVARREYIAAFLLEPENPFHTEQLGGFYLRNEALYQAIETWRQGFERTQDPRLWWHVWFWEKVTRERGDALTVMSSDWWGRIPDEIARTEPDAFLDPAFLEKYETPPAVLAQSESYHWLWILGALQAGDEALALERLRTMPLGQPELAQNLRMMLMAVLDWRIQGRWPRDVALVTSRKTHRFLKELESYRVEPKSGDDDELEGLEAFLDSKWAISSLFLANGWMGAAKRLQVNPISMEMVRQDERLNWLPFAMVKMEAILVGDDAAIAMAERYPSDLSVQGLVGELMIKAGDVESGLKRLASIMYTETPAGYRAAYLRGLAALETLDFDLLDEIMKKRLDLAASVSGRELMARAAISKGSPSEAYSIYNELGDESIEGSVYRYRIALEKNEREVAEKIIKGLITLAPNEPIFHQWKDELERNHP